MVTVLSLVVALSVVVFVHELGHLLAAKRAKVVVEEFGFGYPPRVFTFWHSEGDIVIGGRKIVIPREVQVAQRLAGSVSRGLPRREPTKGPRGVDPR